MVKKVNQKRVTNSKELRKLRAMLPDSVAREHFLSEAILSWRPSGCLPRDEEAQGCS